jgi:hypothetical protein
MYTSILAIVLSGSLIPVDIAKTPSWLTDYSKATKQGLQANKPLAVVVGTGADGWQKLGKQGKLSDQANEILASEYVCLYVDTDTLHGKRLAEAFEMPDGPGIVISDRTLEHQAFRHEGNLSNRTLVGYLERYADPDLVVRTTETNPGTEIQPAYYPPVFYRVMRGGC